jgi:hypothetical protein
VGFATAVANFTLTSTLTKAAPPAAKVGREAAERPSAAGWSLEPNLPNPFNPRTVIRYGVAQESRVTLAVYNIRGQEVRRLIDAERQEAGYREVLFDAKLLPSGVYFYRLRATSLQDERRETFLGVRRMVVLR